MDFWFDLAVTILLQNIKLRGKARKAFPALAKVHAKLEMLEQLEDDYKVEIELQRAKGVTL